MNGRNCPNCGAPYEIDQNKCAYCGTSYFDMSAINFTDGEPFYLKFKMDMGGRECYVTQLVKPSIGGISFESETEEVVDCFGKPILTVQRSQRVVTDIQFTAIQAPGSKELFTVSIQ